MTKNPFINAGAALAYIVTIALLMSYITRAVSSDVPILTPILALSVFTLSAAVMGYIFVSQPLRLYLDGEKQAGVSLFLQTIGVFAGITAVVMVLLISRIFS